MSAVVIIKGEDKTLQLTVRDRKTGDPFTIPPTGEGVSYKAFFRSSTGSRLEVSTVTLVSSTLGKVNVALTDEQTAALKAGVQSFELEINNGAFRTLVQFQQQLDVRERV